MLNAEHLTVRYGEKEAVSDISLRIREGEWWTVVGPNGAGKSTLAGALGRTVPFDGTVTLDGKDIRSVSSREYARSVGILSQNHSSVYGFTVEEVVSLGRYARHGGFFRTDDPDGALKVSEALERAGLSDLRRRNMLTLSGGGAQAHQGRRASADQRSAQERSTKRHSRSSLSSVNRKRQEFHQASQSS